MKQLVSLVAIALLVFPSLLRAQTEKPVRSTTALSADEIEIYKSVLRLYSEGKDVPLNVSATTYPLNADSPRSGLGSPDCLNGILLEDIATASHSYHELPARVLPSKAMRLADPKAQAGIVHSNDPENTIQKGKSVKDSVEGAFATALFSMSEIAFDKNHRFAVVTYSFWCGSLCGNGSTLVFENVNGKWRNAKRNCGSWIS